LKVVGRKSRGVRVRNGGRSSWKVRGGGAGFVGEERAKKQGQVRKKDTGDWENSNKEGEVFRGSQRRKRIRPGKDWQVRTGKLRREKAAG
jgi:hypothetical protein